MSIRDSNRSGPRAPPVYVRWPRVFGGSHSWATRAILLHPGQLFFKIFDHILQLYARRSYDDTAINLARYLP
jgi:hypothetical protein